MITLQVDKPHWEAEIKSKFDNLERRLQDGMNSVLSDTRVVIKNVIKRERIRPNVNRGHAGLEAAIIASTYIGRMNLTLGDVKTLDQLAIYWHAIEVGSDHILGRKVFGFDGPQGINAPNPSRYGKDSDTVSASDAKSAGVTPGEYRVVTHPITPHDILEQTSTYLVGRYTAEVASRFKEVFAGTP